MCIFAEDAAHTGAARHRCAAARITGTAEVRWAGSCYIEFGDGLVGKVEADSRVRPKPVTPFLGPSVEFAQENVEFAESVAAAGLPADQPYWPVIFT